MAKIIWKTTEIWLLLALNIAQKGANDLPGDWKNSEEILGMEHRFFMKFKNFQSVHETFARASFFWLTPKKIT
jgi:hypothetical protein